MTERPPVVVDHEPKARLTRIANTALEAARAHPEYDEDVKIVLLIEDGTEGGIGASGYTETAQLVTDTLMHVAAIMKSNGQSFAVMLDDELLDLTTHVWGIHDE